MKNKNFNQSEHKRRDTVEFSKYLNLFFFCYTFVRIFFPCIIFVLILQITSNLISKHYNIFLGILAFIFFYILLYKGFPYIDHIFHLTTKNYLGLEFLKSKDLEIEQFFYDRGDYYDKEMITALKNVREQISEKCLNKPML